MPQTNPRWRTGAILKNWKILISSQPIDRFWQNLACWCWCVSTLWTPVTNKISRFQKSKMATAAILKIRKIAISPRWNERFWRNLVQWCVWDPQIPAGNKNSLFRKYKMAAAAILKNRKILISSNRLTNILHKWLCYWRGTACGIICVILRFAVVIQYRNGTDTHTDRRTNSRRWHIPHLA